MLVNESEYSAFFGIIIFDSTTYSVYIFQNPNLKYLHKIQDDDNLWLYGLGWDLKMIFSVNIVAGRNSSSFWSNINSLAPGRSGCDSKIGIFNLVLLIGIFRSSHDNALRWMPQDLTVNIDSGNGLVPSGNKPLPEPMLTQFLVALWRRYASMS